MEICRSCYYFAPKEDRACKKVFCAALEEYIWLSIKCQRIKVEDISNFEIVNNIVKEGAEQWKNQ